MNNLLALHRIVRVVETECELVVEAVAVGALWVTSMGMVVWWGMVLVDWFRMVVGIVVDWTAQVRNWRDMRHLLVVQWRRCDVVVC